MKGLLAIRWILTYFQIMVGMLYHTMCDCVFITRFSFLKGLLPDDRQDPGVLQTLLVCYVLLNPQSKPDVSKSVKFSLIFIDISFGDFGRPWGDWRWQAWRYLEENMWRHKNNVAKTGEGESYASSLLGPNLLAGVFTSYFCFQDSLQGNDMILSVFLITFIPETSY